MDDVGKWMNSKQLKRNEDEIECLVVSKNNELRRLDISPLRIKDDTLTVKKAAKYSGVIIDCTLSIKEQISQMVRTAGYHLKNISLVKKYLNKTMKMPVYNNEICKLHYCNSLYYELP